MNMSIQQAEIVTNLMRDRSAAMVHEVKDYAWRLGCAETEARDSEATTNAAIADEASQTLSDLIDDQNDPDAKAILDRVLSKLSVIFSVELVALAELSERAARDGNTAMAGRFKSMPMAVLAALRADRPKFD